jgi:aminodeoxyfutalosine deaminase
VHAGETGTPDNVRAALDDLGADRIGHGIAAVRDPDLVARLVREQVPLEVCPSSNVTLSIVEDLDAHPIRELWEAGVEVTVNSDDPPFFATTLTDELAHARRLLALDRRGLAELQRRAARAAFAPEHRRADLVAASTPGRPQGADRRGAASRAPRIDARSRPWRSTGPTACS